MNGAWWNESMALVGIASVVYQAIRSPEGAWVRPRSLTDRRWLTWLAGLVGLLGACLRWGCTAVGAVIVGMFALATLATFAALGARAAWGRLGPRVRRVLRSRP